MQKKKSMHVGLLRQVYGVLVWDVGGAESLAAAPGASILLR